MKKKRIPTYLRLAVLDRDGRRCLWCGQSAADHVTLHLDHVFPEVMGGLTTYDNLGTLCDQCNIAKGDRSYGDYLLTTVIKIGDIEQRITDKDLATSLGPDGKDYDGIWHEIVFSFFKFDGSEYRQIDVKHHYIVSGILLISQGPSVELKLAFIEKKALLELKHKIRDHLIENRGFLELIDDKLVFQERRHE